MVEVSTLSKGRGKMRMERSACRCDESRKGLDVKLGELDEVALGWMLERDTPSKQELDVEGPVHVTVEPNVRVLVVWRGRGGQ
jgi:hypothetical protein